MKKSTGTLMMMAALSMSWTALAQQNSAAPAAPSAPAPTAPGTAQPGAAQPGTAQPGTAQPSTAQPSSPSSSGTATPGSSSQSGTGGLQTISCTQRANQGKGATGTAANATSGTNSATGTTGMTGTGNMGAGNTAAGTAATGNAGSGTTGTAGSATGTTGSATGTGQTGMSGTTAAGTAGTTSTGTAMGTTGSAGTAGTPSTSTPGTATSSTATPSTGNSATTGRAQGRMSLSNLSVNEVCFLDKAAASNQFELQTSQLALQKSSNPAVKKVAQQIIKDHQAAGASLKSLAAQYGAAPSTALNTQQQALLTTLKGQSGKTFDVTYLAQQVSAHNEAINLFRSYSQPANSPSQSVRQFAAKTLPGLTMHGQMIQSTQKTVTGSAAQSGSTGTQPAKPAAGSK